MRTELDATTIDRYRADGFVTVRGLLDADELAAWRDAVDTALASRTSRLPHGREPAPGSAAAADGDGPRTGDAAAFYERVFVQRINLWMDHAEVRDRILDRRLGGLVAALTGVDEVRVWHDQALVKAPWANPTSFHTDVPYWSFDSAAACSVWIALDDVTVENGCLWFFPGSHRVERYDAVDIGADVGALFDVRPELRGVEAVPVPLAAGDCSFHNGLTVHGAGPNLTPRPRRAMTCAFMPGGSRFNGKQNVLPDAWVETLAVGDVLDRDDLVPRVWP